MSKLSRNNMKIDLSKLMEFHHKQDFPIAVKGVKITTIAHNIVVGTADLVFHCEHGLTLSLNFSEGIKVTSGMNVKLETKKSLGAKQQ